MINITKENIEKYNLAFKAGLYKSDKEEAIEYLEKQEAEKIANKTWQQKRIEAYGSWQEQLDEIYHSLRGWKKRISLVKKNIPKI